MKTTLTLFLFFTIFTFGLQSQIILVPQDQPTIQEAINIAEEHDTVLVSQGEYFENINFNGKNIVVCSNFALSNEPEDIISTIINGSNPVYADTGSCVLIVSGEDSTAVLQGFTITGGTGTRWEDEHGPGLWYTEGGGILIQYSSPTIKNNIIAGNEAINKPAGTTSAGGGGIRCGDGNPHIYNNFISYNQGRYGAGIVMNYSGAIIKNNVISGNSGGEDFGGGGLWFLSNGDEPLIVENNTIVNNAGTTSGGGIRLWSSVATLTNNIFWGNTAVTSPQIRGTTGIVSYCCVDGGFNGEGNIEDNPLFSPDFYILSEESPCIDAGNADESFNDPEDPENPGYALFPAKGLLHSDIGVYGGFGCMQLPYIITGIGSSSEFIKLISVDVFPNPSSNSVSINVSTNSENIISIQIYDLNSALIRNITEKRLISDNYFTKVDISKLSSGIYFIAVKTSNEVQIIKLIKT